jgi:hypothetical protein
VLSNETTIEIKPAPQFLEDKWEGLEQGREKAGKATLTFTGNKIDFKGGDEREWYKATFVLPRGSEPQQLVSTVTDCPFPSYIGKTSFSILKIEEETLTLVGNEPGEPDFPTTLKGTAMSRTFVFRRDPPKTAVITPFQESRSAAQQNICVANLQLIASAPEHGR